MKSRRDILKLAGLGAAGSILQPFNLMSCTNSEILSRPLSVQLYTIREAIAKDARAAIQKLAEIGFKTVETAFWPEHISLKQAAALLQDFGFTVSSAHIEIPSGDQKKAFLETAEAFRCKKLIWHGWPEDTRYSTPEGTRDLARIYNDAAGFAKDNGLSFGLHNHWWEFRNDVGGKKPFEILLEELDEEIFFELDTYWIKVAGLNPAEVIRKFGRRAEFLHIKDGPARWHESLEQDNPDPMTSVGKGSLDMPSILKAAAENNCTLVVEMDKTDGDVFEKLKESFEYLSE
ncbi:MAG: sugar phosphate isomerase/epimerase family protein [Cyclobacteriaceae bacterium]